MTYRRLQIPSLILMGTLFGCGVGPGPNLNGPQGPNLMAAYSGEWVLLRMESDNLETELREAMSDGRRPAGGGAAGRPGGTTGGRGGGVTGGRGGGRTGGRGGGVTGGQPQRRPGGGSRNPEDMRRGIASIRAIAITPLELELTLRPETVALVWGSDPDVVLTLGAEEEALLLGPVEYFATAEWTNEGLKIKKKVDGGGEVEDKVSIDDQGHLVIERTIDLPMVNKVKGNLVYRRR